MALGGVWLFGVLAGERAIDRLRTAGAARPAEGEKAPEPTARPAEGKEAPEPTARAQGQEAPDSTAPAQGQEGQTANADAERRRHRRVSPGS
jgi:hypothetical protein